MSAQEIAFAVQDHVYDCARRYAIPEAEASDIAWEAMRLAKCGKDLTACMERAEALIQPYRVEQGVA